MTENRKAGTSRWDAQNIDDEIYDMIDAYLNGDDVDEDPGAFDPDEVCCHLKGTGKHTAACDARFFGAYNLGKYGKDDDDFALFSLGSSSSSYSSHSHRQQAFELADGTTVYASSHHWRNAEEEPDLGIYLDGCWKPATVAFHIGWQDYGLPYLPMEKIKVVATHALEAARAGLRVEVGCIGGHGRTGTFLAMLDVLAQEGRNPLGSIATVRAHHCRRAIETADQEWYVEAWAAWLRGDEIPERPKKPVVGEKKKLDTAKPKKTKKKNKKVSRKSGGKNNRAKGGR